MNFVLPRAKYKPPACLPTMTGKGKILVVACDKGWLHMANGKIFSTGTNPSDLLIPLMHFSKAGFALQFATVSGAPAVLEPWNLPTKRILLPDRN